MVWSKIQDNRNGVAAGDFTDWKQQNTVFSDLNAWSGTSFNIATKDQPQFLQASLATPGLLQMEGEPLFLGRYFLPEEGQAGHEHVVILTHKLWLKLGADPKIVGTTLRLDGEPYTVVGVQAPGDQDRGQNQLTVPLVFKPEQLNHDFHWLLVMGRMKPGVTLHQAQQNMDAVTAHIAQVYPKSDKGWGAKVEPLKNDFLPPERIQMLWLLLGAVGFVLLIACVNVANLLLARGMTRQKELAVRSALGAARATIFGQLLTESLLLTLAGGALGVGVGYAMLQGLIAVMPPDTLPNEADLRLNIPILLFTLGATTLAGLLAGSAPAWYASRVDPGETLKEGGRTGTSAGKASAAACSGDRGVRAGAGVAGRRGTGDSQLLESHPGGPRRPDGSRADVLSARARFAIEGSSADQRVLPGYPGAHRRGSRGFPRDGDDRVSPVWRRLRHAVHAGGRNGLRRSIAAARSRLWDGDAGLCLNVRDSYGEGTVDQRTGHRRQRKSGDGERVVRQEISAGERSAAATRGGGAAHSRRAKAWTRSRVADCRGVSGRACGRLARTSRRRCWFRSGKSRGRRRPSACARRKIRLRCRRALRRRCMRSIRRLRWRNQRLWIRYERNRWPASGSH